jgi:hypothetical protein
MISFRACVESSKRRGKGGVYLIKTIKKPFESLIAGWYKLWSLNLSPGNLKKAIY